MNRFIGIPFSDNAESFDGANCYGLARLFYKEELGIIIPKLDVPSAKSNKVFATFLHEISENWEEIKEPELGCIVAMAHDLSHPRIVQHVGVYIGNNKILHTINKLDSHVSKLDILKPVIKGYYKWQH